MRSRVPVLIALIAIAGSAGTPGAGAAASGTTVRVSVDMDGGDPDGTSEDPVISGDGSRVAFESAATNLVDGDTNGTSDVFVRSVADVTTVRASVDLDGGDPNGFSGQAAISASGRYVAFVSSGSDLVPADDNGLPDAFVRDLEAGTTIRVGTDAGDPRLEQYATAISADGRFAAFVSFSALVPEDGNGLPDVYVHDRTSGATRRASVDMEGGDPDGESLSPSMSGDGRYVAFSSAAGDLVSADGNGFSDVFVRDMATGTTVRASVDRLGGDPNGPSSLRPAMSANGRYVTFSSRASDLVPGDRAGLQDVFVRDLRAGTTVRVSVDRVGGDPNGPCLSSAISANGRYVAYRSVASDLVAGDDNGLRDIFVRDLQADLTARITVDLDGDDSDGESFNPAISWDGQSIAFVSWASDLVPGDGNAFRDAFVRQMTP